MLKVSLPLWWTADAVALLAHGLLLTVLFTLVTTVTSLVVGLIIGSWRLSTNTVLRHIAGIFVEVHRNVPALVLVIFWAFAVPNLFPPDVRKTLFFANPVITRLTAATGLPLIYYVVATIVALTLNTSAYIAEIFRAGVGTIAQEHVDAARTLGASRSGVYWSLLLPQGVRASFPALSARLVHNMKNTSLAALVAVPELFRSTETAMSLSFQAMPFLLLTTGLYLATAVGLSWMLSLVERRLNHRSASTWTTAAATNNA